MRIVYYFFFAFVLVSAQTPTPLPKENRPPWQQGFHAVHQRAQKTADWQKIKSWVADCASETVPSEQMSVSTDLSGGKHRYSNTYRAGYRDGCFSLQEVMAFIALANAGDDLRLMAILDGYLEQIKTTSVVPPGHF